MTRPLQQGMPLMLSLVTDMTDFAFVDSGVGGIPYMLRLLEKEPSASCVYIADTKNFPYGTKTHEQVVNCVVPLIEKIRTQFSPSVFVLACNTISVNALETLRKTFPDTQFVGTVPAIKLAASVSKKRRIGLIATKATCENPYNLELKKNFANDCELVLRADGELVSFIENNAFTATREECLNAIKPAVEFFRNKDCDVIILGCTHFLNFTELFKEACGTDITVVDSVDGVVRHAISVAKDSFTPGQNSKAPLLLITGNPENSERSQYNVICERYNIKFSTF